LEDAANLRAAAVNLSGVRVYPNPWRSDRHGTSNVTFDRLTAGATVKIFTVSGRWLRTLIADANGEATWDRRTDSGDAAASGIYLYLATDPQGDTTKGKFTLIR
jgi:hypothetical protein